MSETIFCLTQQVQEGARWFVPRYFRIRKHIVRKQKLDQDISLTFLYEKYQKIEFRIENRSPSAMSRSNRGEKTDAEIKKMSDELVRFYSKFWFKTSKSLQKGSSKLFCHKI